MGMRWASLALISLVAACAGPAHTSSPTPSTPPVAPISVTRITIHTAVDPTRKSQSPLYTYALARGHYIVATHVPTSGEPFIAYDGRQVANTDPNEAVDVFISSDGTHYGYQVWKRNGSIEVYVDGTLYSRLPTGLQLFAMTNAGEPVYSAPAQGQSALYRGGNILASAPRGFVIVRVSGDGSHWLAYQRGDLGGNGSLVMDGKVLLPSPLSFPQDQFVLLSENGKHWSCYLQAVGTGNLLIDGVTRSSTPAILSLAITNSGHVAWVDSADGSTHVDDHMIPFPSAFQVAINDDASHILVRLRDGKPVLDGTPIDIGTSFAAEFVGSTLYAYIFVQ